MWDFYRARHQQLSEIEPNEAHYTIAKLEKFAKDNGYQFWLITQNVDGLHLAAGSENVIELHGDLRTLRCSNDSCSHTTTDEIEWKKEEVPVCPVCNSLMRVNVIWFGEMLPDGHFELASMAALLSERMLVVGTSGVVQPAASLVGVADRNDSWIYECNPEPAFGHLAFGYSQNKYRCFRGKASSVVPLAVKMIMDEVLTKNKYVL